MTSPLEVSYSDFWRTSVPQRPSVPHSCFFIIRIDESDHSLPFQQTLKAVLDLALRLAEVNGLDLLVELFDVCIF